MTDQDRRVFSRLSAPDALNPLPAGQVETATALVAALKAKKEAFQAARYQHAPSQASQGTPQRALRQTMLQHAPRETLLPPALGSAPTRATRHNVTTH